MYCTKDCDCSLCRELRGFRPPKSDKKLKKSDSFVGSENFILKRCDIGAQRNGAQQNDESRVEKKSATPPAPLPPKPQVSLAAIKAKTGDKQESSSSSKHKVIIYFGDSIENRQNKDRHHNNNNNAAVAGQGSDLKDLIHASRLCDEMVLKTCESELTTSPQPTQPILRSSSSSAAKCIDSSTELPSFIESIHNGVINIRIHGNYKTANDLVATLSTRQRNNNNNNSTSSNTNSWDIRSQSEDSFDWSFVQEWRSRPSGSTRVDILPFNSSSQSNSQLAVNISSGNLNACGVTSPTNNNNNNLQPPDLTASTNCGLSSGRIQSPAVATPAPRISKEVAQRLAAAGNQSTSHHESIDGYSPNNKSVSGNVNASNAIERDHHQTKMGSSGGVGYHLGQSKPVPHRSVAGPARLTAQSTPVKSQPPMISGSLSSQNKTPSERVIDNLHASQKQNLGTRTHHHEFRGLQRVQECHSSSDENRSSGHASMSDTGGHGSSSPGGALGPLPEDRLAAGVTNRSTRSRASTNHSRSRHRATPAKVPWGGSGLEDIKLAIQQLTMRSQTSTSTYSSLSAGSESSEPARRLGRYSSLETVNTNVTSADEFVWVDSHNRLVELQHPPWSQHCILRVIRNGRCKEHSERVSIEAVPRLGYLLQRALVRIAREVQRLSSNLGLCSKQEIAGAFKVVLCPGLADSCIKACLRAAAMFAVPGESALKQSKSSRAGLQLPVGRFHRWMADARLGKFIHEYAAVYLCAGMENLLEEILLQCFSSDANAALTATGLEQAIASSGDLWGLLQPYAHLNAGRVASGALTMPRWASQTSIGSGSHQNPSVSSSLEPCLLTTCVGSITELKDLVSRAQQKFQHTAFSNSAITALFYFMRCSQLEHSEVGSSTTSTTNTQELCYERAYVVLPPLVEWLRVSSAHAEYRNAIMIDKDDIMQAARLLLPGVDCPTRGVGRDEELPSKKTHFGHSSSSVSGSSSEDTADLGRRATLALAFKLMLTGRADMLAQASTLLPPTTRYDTLNHVGMSALMIASIRNDDIAIQALLDAGCDPNIEVPAVGSQGCPAIHPDTQHWTAVTFASCKSNFQALRMLLDRGGKVEGGARLSEDKSTLTPLQVACGSGNLEVVSLLLAHGAHAFLSTQQKDSMCFANSAQRGCYCAISVAAAHGQRACLRKLLSHPLAPGSREVLSLEEMLAEGDSSGRAGAERQQDVPPSLNKTQIKSLQEAMYHSAENNHLDITVELRALGVPWTLHCWMHALAAAHELRLDAVIDQLLQDFLQVCPDDYSPQFVSECLPLLFNIFRYSKNEGTTLLLADIFATCFGWEAIKSIKEPVLQPVNSSRIDPKFVNNPELSDVTFRVEGKIFYGHKIVLVTASPRFQNMLSSKLSDGNAPTVQINDIRYHIFQLVMQYLYSGGCNNLEVSHNDVLELMAAASFFQLEGLLRYTEARCSEMIDIDNVVAMYIHAKVYNASKLMEYCQGFLLQNMVALLTYDDSVKRLLFAKKIPNHDVLSGLLMTLQARIKNRKPGSTNFSRPQISSPAALKVSPQSGVKK
ncbi:ankyrin repeat and BTB/POZ domain-containing protein 2 isoform X2 [Episyrphus balteatus]|uniref:ankyrin repeat and BTB/POZ domain-containing protein 2 isoform X2 n=1 Tax=Episyrphus balteatus TaxID=286459 RepID=UPI00248614E0|nr:ankyrin repeat and BTB/POZ domain-containing protein 2 isoform X2 [Episyrphus balteatus]